MPLISVIIPVYNGEKTIQETITSVLQQTFTDFELIIINDGSQDSTLAIISSIPDPRIKIFSYPNSGVAASRNRGISKAQGEFIASLDADDLWSVDKLEAQLATLQSNPQAAVAYSWSDCIDESSQFLRKGGHITVSGDAFAKLLLVDILENGSNSLIRKQALTQLGDYDESMAAGQDWEMHLRLAARFQFVCVPRPQVFYRISTHSMSNNVWRLEQVALEVINRNFRNCPDDLKYLKSHSLANIYKYLTVKSLEGIPEQAKGIAAIKFLAHAVKNDPSLLHKRITLKVLIKAVIFMLFSPQKSQALLTKARRLTGTGALLMHMQVNV